MSSRPGYNPPTMSGPLGQIRNRFKLGLKKRLSGNDIETLVQNRSRRRLRWLAETSADPILGSRALRNLAEMMDPDSADLFLSILQEDPGERPTPLVRAAAEGLGRMLYGDAGPTLRRLLGPHRPFSVSLSAARALATIGREEDWIAIRNWAVEADEDGFLLPDERDATVPLGREPVGLTPVVWVLETLYADKGARWWTSKASSWLRGDEVKPRMASDKGADKIVAQGHRRALQGGELTPEEFRTHALHLGTLSLERDHHFFVELVAQQTDPRFRRTAIQALGLQGDIRSVPILKSWLASLPEDQPSLAADLARAVGRLGWSELSEDLAALRPRFEDQEVRLNIAWALGECTGPQAVQTLIELVRSRDEQLSELEFEWIARSLRRCGNRGREAIRGGVAIARAGGGERNRMQRLAELGGIH